jgi:hypothetical protein
MSEWLDTLLNVKGDTSKANSSDGRYRHQILRRSVARSQGWLNARLPAEEILVVGATLDAANELARSLARKKRALFGYHRLTLGQLASALARPTLAL